MLPSRTGLAVSSVATVFKLLWWRDEAGLDLRGLQWLCLPELVCHGLGAGLFAERSMLGRTALWDIHDEAPYAAAPRRRSGPARTSCRPGSPPVPRWAGSARTTRSSGCVVRC